MDKPSPSGASAANARSDEMIKHMVQRFLGWKLPEDFCPDGGISFTPMFNEHTLNPGRHEPSGTNLFDATQAEAMVRYMLDGLPDSNARSATPAAPRQPEGGQAPKSEPEGQDLSAQELADFRRRFFNVDDGMPVEEVRLTVMRLIDQAERAQPQAHAQPAPADAAPLDALREGRDLLIELRHALLRTDAGADHVDIPWSFRKASTIARLSSALTAISAVIDGAALASAEGASAAPRLQPEGHIPLGAPDARLDRVLHALAVAYDQPHREYCNKGDETPGCGACKAESNMWTEFRLLVFGSADPHSACDATATLEKQASGPSPDVRLVAALAIADRYYALAPKHAHMVPGIWDMDNVENGVWAGKPCQHCADLATDGERLIALASSVGTAPDALLAEALELSGLDELLKDLADCRYLKQCNICPDRVRKMRAALTRAVLRRGGR